MASLRQKIPLKRRKILKKTLSKLAGAAVIAALISGVYFFLINPSLSAQMPQLAFLNDPSVRTVAAVLGWIVLTLIVASPALGYELIYYLSYYYDMDDKNVIIRKGVITKKEITLPFNKITDVYVDQDIGDVALGLYDVHISTPTVDSGLFAHIDGVDKQGSVELRRMILEQINQSSE